MKWKSKDLGVYKILPKGQMHSKAVNISHEATSDGLSSGGSRWLHGTIVWVKKIKPFLFQISLPFRACMFMAKKLNFLSSNLDSGLKADE